MNPIRVDWVDLTMVPALAESPGRLGMTFLPGKRDIKLGGTNDRDLESDVGRLRDVYELDAFVLLVEDHELRMLGVPNIADAMARHGIEFVRHPIVDVNVPDDQPAFRQTLDGIRSRLANGETVAIACRGGVGRTGTLVGCLVRDGGLTATEAIALTRASRNGTIETPAQERFVKTWAA
jgi:protein-tyrosine phosphatase